MATSAENAEKIGLPPRPFFYTLDQVSTLIDVPMDRLSAVYLYYTDRMIGPPKKDQIRCVNLAPVGETPDWRIAENELMRWFRHKKIRIHNRTWLS